jgi:hypothetical protein
LQITLKGYSVTSFQENIDYDGFEESEMALK